MNDSTTPIAEAAEFDSAGPAATDRPAEQAPSTKPFFILWSGQALSLLGSQVVQFALIWWLTIETGSATVLATATLVALLPTALMGPFIGPFIDRWSRKRVMFFADSAVAAAAAVLAGLFLVGAARPAHVLTLLFVRAVCGAFHGPAMLASTSLMVPKQHFSRIQGLNQSLQGGLTIVSAPIGAFLVGLWPMAAVMAVDVITAGFAIAPLLFITIPRPPRSSLDGGAAAKPSMWREMIAGLRYLQSRHGHIGILIMAATINLCLTPAFSLLPLLVNEQLGGDAAQLGWMTSAFGIGLLVGGLALGAWGGFKRRILTSLTAIVGLGAVVLFLGFAPAAAWVALVCSLLLVGFMATMANGPLQAVLQATVAPDFQGRVFTLYASLATLTTPIGLMLAAPVAELLGVRTWYLIGGAVCILMGSAAFFVPAIVRIEEG